MHADDLPGKEIFMAARDRRTTDAKIVLSHQNHYCIFSARITQSHCIHCQHKNLHKDKMYSTTFIYEVLDK